MPTNSLNLKQLDGGTVIKQGDSSSLFKFELLDENNSQVTDLNGQEAIITLGRAGEVQWRKVVTVVDNIVSFKIDQVLEPGSYILEISVGGYVFPSDVSAKLKVQQANGSYSPKPLGSDSLTNPETIKFIKELTAQIVAEVPRGESAEDVERRIQEAIGQIPQGLTRGDVESLVRPIVAQALPQDSLTLEEVAQLVDEKVRQIPQADSHPAKRDLVPYGYSILPFDEYSGQATFSNGVMMAADNSKFIGIRRFPQFPLDAEGRVTITTLNNFPELVLGVAKGWLNVEQLLQLPLRLPTTFGVYQKALDDEQYSFDYVESQYPLRLSDASRIMRVLFSCGALNEKVLEDYRITKKRS